MSLQLLETREWDSNLPPFSPFFFTSSWLDNIHDTYNLPLWKLYSTSQSGQITGFLPIFEIKSRIFGHRLVSIPFCEYGGPLLVEEYNPSSVSSLMKQVVQIQKQTQAKYLKFHMDSLMPNIEKLIWFQSHTYSNFRTSELYF